MRKKPRGFPPRLSVCRQRSPNQMLGMYFDLLESPYATLCYSISWYLLFRMITTYASGDIILTKNMRRFFFPFSHRRTATRSLIIILSFSYIELLLFAISRIPCVAQYIGNDFVDYNVPCLFLLFLSTASICFESAFVDIRGSMPASPIMEKIEFFFVTLVGIGILGGCSFVIICFVVNLVKNRG